MVELILVGCPVTQSSSLSVEDHTVRCVVGSEPTRGDGQVPSMGTDFVNSVQLIVPTSVVWV